MRELTGIRALVVDDYSGARRIYRNALMDFGISSVVDTDASAALQIVEDGSFDLVIVGIEDREPNEAGLSLIRLIRSNVRLKKTAILADAVTDKCIQAAVEAGADGYLGWPNTFENWHKRIGVVLNRSIIE